jgi:hypothetical protein
MERRAHADRVDTLPDCGDEEIGESRVYALIGGLLIIICYRFDDRGWCCVPFVEQCPSLVLPGQG